MENLGHAQAVDTRPFSPTKGHGDEATLSSSNQNNKQQ